MTASHFPYLTKSNILFALDADLTPVPMRDPLAWAERVHMQGGSTRHVGDDTIAGFRVSTAFMGTNLNPGSFPKTFEAAVFDREGSIYVIGRYPSWAEALAMHRQIVAFMSSKDGAGLPIVPIEIRDFIHSIPECEARVLVGDALVELGAPAHEALLRAQGAMYGKLHMRNLGDAGMVALQPRSLTGYSIVAGLTLAADGYAAVWEYTDYDAAKAALDAWDGAGEPAGYLRRWIRAEGN